jgi:peptidoglycan L-alanyl-D-glutamate endopeptidase CwlK
MYKFNTKSKTRLASCNRNLQRLCKIAIKYTDFSIIAGHRDKQEQDNKFNSGLSRLKWPSSKHNKEPSQAVDVAPYIRPYGVLTGHPNQIRDTAKKRNCSLIESKAFICKAYARLIGILEGIAFENNIELRVGIDWDGDFDLLDQTFHDLGHIEIKEIKRGWRSFWKS